jgi:hypothetical protein
MWWPVLALGVLGSWCAGEPTYSTYCPEGCARSVCLSVVAHEDCPLDADIDPCDTPALGVGDFCEGDGECGTDPNLDNCMFQGKMVADVYRIESVLAPTVGPTAPTAAPTAAPPQEMPTNAIHALLLLGSAFGAPEELNVLPPSS